MILEPKKIKSDVSTVSPSISPEVTLLATDELMGTDSSCYSSNEDTSACRECVLFISLFLCCLFLKQKEEMRK